MEIIDKIFNFGKQIGEHNINVLMIGAQRCGKSTLLSSMYKNINNTFNGTSLVLNLDPILETKLDGISNNLTMDYFTQIDPNRFFKADQAPTFDKKEYKFGLNIGSQYTKIAVNFIDFPGEFLTNSPEDTSGNRELVKTLIKKSHVIMIAIDTPCLMEQYEKNNRFGKYHGQMNKPDIIELLITSEMTTDDIKDRMVLFVPIKCEKYYYRGQMSRDDGYGLPDEVTMVDETVINGYKKLIDSLTQSDYFKSNCTTAITPILTIGGIELFNFDNKENCNNPGELEKFHYTGQYNNYPEKIKKIIGSNYARYTPRFCDQPLIYVFAYILKVSEKSGWNKGILNSMLSALKIAPDGISLEHELSKVAGRIKTSGDGYKILNDHLNIGGFGNAKQKSN